MEEINQEKKTRPYTQKKRSLELVISNGCCDIAKKLPIYLNGIIATSYDIFATTHGLSPPIYTALTHGFWNILSKTRPDIKKEKPNKRLLIGNFMSIGIYTYYNYGEPIREFLNKNILFG